MQISFHLRRRSESTSAVALLLPSRRLDDLRTVIARLSLKEWPKIYVVADGFVIRLSDSRTDVVPGTMRLRAMTPNLLLPVDADLLPTLHDHEANALTEGRGLVFLPGNRVLFFDPIEPLPISRVLSLPDAISSQWKRLPESPKRPDRLQSIQRIFPNETVEAIIAEGLPDEPETPPEQPPGAARRGFGRAAMWTGSAFGRLGQFLGLGALSRLGAGLANMAMRVVPQLSHEVLGRQEAALRDLLKQFREGNVEAALRRALPMGSGGDRPGVAANDANLPDQHTGFSLRRLLERGGRGAGSIWYGGGDVQAELEREYRRVAQEAIDRGDYRRAAYIYGRLLNDIVTAANVLSRGGLHHEAAILFRDRLNDRSRAAREFESAGEFEVALALYRELDEHERAGDLLMKLGDVEAAIKEYLIAAARIVARQEDYHAAGELLLRKTDRIELAEQWFEKGWELRDEPDGFTKNAFWCLMRLVPIKVAKDDLSEFWDLFASGEEFIDEPGCRELVSEFYNRILDLVQSEPLVEHEPFLKDRARLGLASQLRYYAESEKRPGDAVSVLFGNSKHWSPAVVADATFALKHAQTPNAGDTVKLTRPVRWVNLANESVVTATYAQRSNEIVMGFANGKVAIYRPNVEQTTFLSAEFRHLFAVAISDDGRQLVICESWFEHLSELSMDMALQRITMFSYLRNESTGQYQPMGNRVDLLPEGVRLLPFLHLHGDEWITLLSTSSGLLGFRGVTLLAESPRAEEGRMVADGHFPWRRPDGVSREVVVSRDELSVGEDSVSMGWVVQHGPIASPSLGWLDVTPDRAEIVGVSESGAVGLTVMQIDKGNLTRSVAMATCDEGYACAALWRTDRVVAVTRTRSIRWLWRRSNSFIEWAPRTFLLPTRGNVVACFPSYDTGDVLILFEKGDIARVAVPV